MEKIGIMLSFLQKNYRKNPCFCEERIEKSSTPNSLFVINNTNNKIMIYITFYETKKNTVFNNTIFKNFSFF